MGFLVRLAAGSQQFSVEGTEPLLDAALRAGLGVPYGCSSGNCGECKARVVEGRIGQIRSHDYRLTEAEKLQGYALLCCSTALTDLVIEAEVAHSAGEIPQQRVAAQVRRLDRLADSVTLLEIVTPRTNRLRFLAGQSATLELGAISATLPIASCPCEERRLHFHLRRGAGDPVSAALLKELRIGAPVQVSGPSGEFVLREGSARPLVFIAWGWQAFAPVKSIIEHALAKEAADSIELYWIASDASEHYHEKLCRSWAQAMDNFRYSLQVGSTDPRSSVAAALANVGGLPEREFYVAGAKAEVAATRAYLAGAGLSAERLITWSPT
jgi:CDP-4-dehydro-6-deoxyglucose reductase